MLENDAEDGVNGEQKILCGDPWREQPKQKKNWETVMIDNKQVWMAATKQW